MAARVRRTENRRLVREQEAYVMNAIESNPSSDANWDELRPLLDDVARAKNNLQCRVVKRRLKKPDGKILRDDEIVLTGTVSFGRYPTRLRRVVALVEVDGVEREMEFLTNNFIWAPSSVAELYRCRWQIEVFFKQIKQTLQLSDFLGNSANAVRWQVWTALLVYVLLRYQTFLSRRGETKRRDNRCFGHRCVVNPIVPPLQGLGTFSACEPRALPWAVLRLRQQPARCLRIPDWPVCRRFRQEGGRTGAQRR